MNNGEETKERRCTSECALYFFSFAAIKLVYNIVVDAGGVIDDKQCKINRSSCFMFLMIDSRTTYG